MMQPSPTERPSGRPTSYLQQPRQRWESAHSSIKLFVSLVIAIFLPAVPVAALSFWLHPQAHYVLLLVPCWPVVLFSLLFGLSSLWVPLLLFWGTVLTTTCVLHRHEDARRWLVAVLFIASVLQAGLVTFFLTVVTVYGLG